MANGWEKEWKTFENGVQQVSDRLIELAGIRPRYRLLDIATSTGEPAISAAKIVGKDGHVTATDISTEMLGYKRSQHPGHFFMFLHFIC